MKKSVITVTVRMDYKTLRSFSLFDTFLLKKHWIRPAVFGAIFIRFFSASVVRPLERDSSVLPIVMKAGIIAADSK